VRPNARRQQQQLLEVRARWRTVAHARTAAIVKLSAKCVFILSLIGGAIYGGQRALDVLFYQNERYQVRHIEVQSDGNLTREEILNLARIREGMNLFGIDLNKTRLALESVSRVQRAEVERILPDRVRVRVSERKPVAWLAPKGAEETPFSPTSSYHLDPRGIVLRVDEVLPEHLHLPVILGVPVRSVAVGEPLTLPETRAALDLIRLNSVGRLQTRFIIQSIDVSKEYCLIVKDQNKTEVTFALSDLDAQLSRLGDLLAYADHMKQEILTVNLIPKRNVPVTFAAIEPAVIEPAIPVGPPKPSSRKPATNSVPVRKAVPVRPSGGGARNG
jgi:hypothetical protein